MRHPHRRPTGRGSTAPHTNPIRSRQKPQPCRHGVALIIILHSPKGGPTCLATAVARQREGRGYNGKKSEPHLWGDATIPAIGRIAPAFDTAWFNSGQSNSYTISVFDVSGNRQDANFTLTAGSGNAAPRPFITIKPSKAMVGQNVVFSAAQSADPDGSLSAVQVEWDLNNDGVYDTAPTTAKTYTTAFSTAGTRQVRARLTDANGASTISTIMGLRITSQPASATDWQLLQ
jgi:hypothetical protein